LSSVAATSVAASSLVSASIAAATIRDSWSCEARAWFVFNNSSLSKLFFLMVKLGLKSGTQF
jgi:hypothetical protein